MDCDFAPGIQSRLDKMSERNILFLLEYKKINIIVLLLALKPSRLNKCYVTPKNIDFGLSWIGFSITV